MSYVAPLKDMLFNAINPMLLPAAALFILATGPP